MGPKIEAILRFVKAPPRRARRHHQRREHRARAARRDRHLDRGLNDRNTMETALLAVNGTLMRGLELNPNLLAVGATFVREDETDAVLPALVDRRPPSGDAAHAGRRARASRSRCGTFRSPASRRSCRASRRGSRSARWCSTTASIVLGVLGEPFLCAGQREITAFGGWRAYTATCTANSSPDEHEEGENHERDDATQVKCGSGSRATGTASSACSPTSCST